MQKHKRKRSKHLLDEWVRVTDKCPCPKCGRPDWCLVHKGGRKVICTREKSGKPVHSKRSGNYGDIVGHIHYIADGYKMPERSEKEHQYLSTRQVQDYITSVTDPRNMRMIEKQANGMGLSVESLYMMQATYDQNKAVVGFPMFDHRRQPIGVRFRRSDGKKFSLEGGQNGVFLSRNFSPQRPVIMVEGPTDSATACWINFDNVLGRASCATGGGIITKLMAGNRTVPIIIISDPDEVGTDGAVSLARDMTNPIVVIAGPCDLREFATKRLQSEARAAIIEGVNGDEVTTWRPVFRNLAGQFFDFVSALQRYTNA